MIIVVARYNENIEWTKQFPNVIIYNKGEKLEDNVYNEIILDNVGREGHTYYKYICDNYDNLEDYTVFLQGNPFDHSPNIIIQINKLINYINNIDNINNIEMNFRFLSKNILNTNLSGCPYHDNLPLKEIYETIFGEKKENMEIKFGAGAQFFVSKTQILKKPKEFYLQIVKMLENDIYPIEGFVIERFHELIFTHF
jgi:hypothetical protein